MSWYYTYYIGIKRQDGKIHLLGMYDGSGRLFPVVEKSRSFESGFSDKFRRIKQEEVSDELKDKFNWNIENGYCKVLPFNEIGNTDYIKRGYFLIEDVNTYISGEHENAVDLGELFVDYLEPTAYAGKMLAERCGIIKYRHVDDDEECEPQWHSYTDYMYFAYPSYGSAEYDAFLVEQACCMLEDYTNNKAEDMYVILTEG